MHCFALFRFFSKKFSTQWKRHRMNEWMNECLFIYRTYHIVSQGGLQFYLSEIGRQLVKAPLAAVISPYLISPNHPTHAWNVQWNRAEQQPEIVLFAIPWKKNTTSKLLFVRVSAFISFIANEPSRAKTRGWRGSSIIEPCVLQKKSRVFVR